jgi:hypothetical protein
MKSVQYLGNEEVALSRFGIINKGAKLDMYEWEWDDIKDSPLFKLLTVAPSKDELELAAKTKPVSTEYFDLRTVPWESPMLHRQLSSRMSKPSLIKLIRGINQAGGYIEDSSVGENRNELIDKIVSAARFMGWDKTTKEQRFAVVLQEPNEQAQEQVKAARQRVKKTVESESNDNHI